MLRSNTLLCPLPSQAVKYLLIVIFFIIIQYLDIATEKHWQTTRNYKFNVTIYNTNYFYTVMAFIEGV